MEEHYIKLGDLLVYRLALQLSCDMWKIYEKMVWQVKKIMGDQVITAIDSIGANIAEGYGRYHYLDRIKFYYNARGSLLEAKHWVYLLRKRNIITIEKSDDLFIQLNNLHQQLNKFIRSCRPIQ